MPVSAESASARAYAEAPMPQRSLPWRQADFTVIDLETTGLDPLRDEIISFATLRVSGGRLSMAGARYQLVRPRRMPGGNSIRIHGLRPADLEHAPPIERALDDLLEAITGAVLVAHVAAVERGFLMATLDREGLSLRNRFVDTAALAAELGRRTPRPPEHLRRWPVGLSDLARGLELPVHRPHHADGDTLTTAQVFLALATHLDVVEPQTVDSLLRPDYALPSLSLLGRLRRRLRRDRIRSSARP